MVGAGSPATHLEFGRALLDMLLPSPSHHESAAQWYRAAAAHLGGKYDHANGLVHLARARRLFPRDAFVLFASGCLHEVLAAPQVQTVIETTRLSHRESFDVESAGLHLRQAERFFAQALENDTTFHEARVRLARVMSLQGRQQEALAELQKVLQTSATLSSRTSRGCSPDGRRSCSVARSPRASRSNGRRRSFRAPSLPSWR
jgi:thioredoxin-like negative regulator of GroEL